MGILSLLCAQDTKESVGNELGTLWICAPVHRSMFRTANRRRQYRAPLSIPQHTTSRGEVTRVHCVSDESHTSRIPRQTLACCEKGAEIFPKLDQLLWAVVVVPIQTKSMGDFQANFLRPDTGIHTVEGNVAGSRAATLSKKRQAEQTAFEARKQKIREDSERGKLGIESKFDVNVDVSVEEQRFRSRTVGLVSAEEFRKASAEAKNARDNKEGNYHLGEDADGLEEAGDFRQILKGEEAQKLDRQRKKEKKKAMKEKKKRMATLSFAGDDEDEEEEEEEVNEEVKFVDETHGNSYSMNGNDEKNMKKKLIMKNPEVDTSFLPDQEREERARAERERLSKEWLARQREMKKELLEITYSYWDGTGHRRTVQCKKGDTVGKFLELVRCDLAKEFREMGNVSSDALLYVKEDLIIPQDISFYDLIATRARGKSGPLFNFDVHEDIRLGAVDARIEKDESHPGKVVERRWYDRNKHIFPASRWEIYDPAKEYGSYTIHGGEVKHERKK
jgi:protein FAM50